MTILNVVAHPHGSHPPLLPSASPYKFNSPFPHFPILSGCIRYTSIPPSSALFLSNMPTQTAKSALLSSSHNYSWLQDRSTNYERVSSSKCRTRQLNSVFPTTPAVVSTVADLFEFICSGPLIEKLGLTPDMVESSIDKWLECGAILCRLFLMNELQLSDAEKIGVSAPQGCGKTTLVFALDYLFRKLGRNSATLSIDDFYLTAEDQAKVRTENPENSLLEFRGNAGTHDLPLSIETLTALAKLTKEGVKMKLPRYNKSAYGGRGDRADPSTWPEVEGPLKVVLFEGWMLGFKPLPNEVVKEVDPQLEVVNKHLEAYYEAWDKFVGSWLVIKIKNPRCVYEWRLQGELAMIADGKPGMSKEEVRDFVSRYMPAYKAYLPTLYSEGPKGSDPERLLLVDIDEERNPILGA